MFSRIDLTFANYSHGGFSLFGRHYVVDKKKINKRSTNIDDDLEFPGNLRYEIGV